MIGFTFLFLSVLMMASGFVITRNNRAGKLTTRYILILLIWTAYIITVVESGVLLTIDVPMIPLMIVIPALTLILLGTSRPVFIVAMDRTSELYPIYMQTFRVLVELMIYGSFLEGVLPESVTFKGMNFDILVGISAPVIAFLARKEFIGKRGIMVWNIIAILILALTISTFARFIYFSGHEISIESIRFLRFPYVLLPCILVPYALFYHTVSIRQCLR